MKSIFTYQKKQQQQQNINMSSNSTHTHTQRKNAWIFHGKSTPFVCILFYLHLAHNEERKNGMNTILYVFAYACVCGRLCACRFTHSNMYSKKAMEIKQIASAPWPIHWMNNRGNGVRWLTFKTKIDRQFNLMESQQKKIRWKYTHITTHQKRIGFVFDMDEMRAPKLKRNSDSDERRWGRNVQAKNETERHPKGSKKHHFELALAITFENIHFQHLLDIFETFYNVLW